MTHPLHSIRDQVRHLYWRESMGPFFDRLFTRLRLKVLPLEVLNTVVPAQGKIVEIGCGHGLICNYLGLANPEREIIGVDIDPRRMTMAKTTLNGRENVHFQEGRFEHFHFINLDMVLLFGVLCVIPIRYWDELFANIHRALKPGGELLLHDIRVDDSMLFRLHTFKETLFRVVGITRGEGVNVMPPDVLEKRMMQYGFTVRALGPELDVPFHSCFTWLLTKQSH